MRYEFRAMVVTLLLAASAQSLSAQDARPDARRRRDAGRTADAGHRAASADVREDTTSRDAGVGDGWVDLGERWVDGPCDHDSIQVPESNTRAVTKILFRAEASDLELYDVVLTFGDGTTFSPSVRLHFREGERSREIDLPGAARVVRRIDFRYGNTPGGGRARLLVLGR